MRRGFTLIELMAAVAILAVVSLMAVQVLGGAIFQRDALLARDDQGAALAMTLALLRRDVESLAPLPPSLEARSPEAGVLALPDGGVAFHRAGILLPDAAGTRTAEVRWRLRDGVLIREVAGVEGGAATEQALLEGVRALSLRALASEPEPLVPAPGYEVLLETEAFGPIRLVVAR